jgi:predicted acyltransferase
MSATTAPAAQTSHPEITASPERLVSLDAFRGATIAAMMLVNNAGDWNNVYAPLLHANWHGWTFTDTVFPFFLWIAGVAMTFSFAKRVDAGADRRHLLLHALKRAALIFLIGLFLNGFPFFPLDRLRIPGVLQRIAVCYLFGSVCFLYLSRRALVWVTGACLVIYWMLMTLVPVPGFGPGVLTKEGNLERYVDSLFLTGHMYGVTKTWDPEGILSTIPAFATILFGVLAGYLLRGPESRLEKTARLFVHGAALLFTGTFIDYFFPINKNLWTTSYAVFMAGLAMQVFAVSFYLIDVRGWQRWARPLVIYGSNAITVYVIAGLLARSLGVLQWKDPLYQTLFAWIGEMVGDLRVGSVAYAVVFVLLLYSVALFMYRRRWFVKL